MTTGDAILDAVIALELRLLDPRMRHDPAQVESLLHPDFREIGASGRVWSRDAVIAALASEPAEAVVASDVVARRVADDVVLVTYTARGSWRSSLWVLMADGWRMLFHQGTPVS